MSPLPLCFLFDNGSLRATATLSLREVAAKLENRLKSPVRAVSLLHSSSVDATELNGIPAELLEPAVKAALSAGVDRIVLLPLFFGLSAALTDYLPVRIASVLKLAPTARVTLGPPLVDPNDKSDHRIANAIVMRVRECVRAGRMTAPIQVVVVDHGSPQPAVTAVRNHLGEQVRARLQDEVAGVSVASMERRTGPEYRFSDPLLAETLRTPPCNRGNVVVALQFMSAGRHAGAKGDVAQIIADACKECPELTAALTDPIGSADPLIDVLVDRFYQAVASSRGQS